MDDGV
jgi:hypothetical protein